MILKHNGAWDSLTFKVEFSFRLSQRKASQVGPAYLSNLTPPTQEYL